MLISQVGELLNFQKIKKKQLLLEFLTNKKAQNLYGEINFNIQLIQKYLLQKNYQVGVLLEKIIFKL